MKKTKRVFYLILALFLLTLSACTPKDSLPNVPNEKPPIVIKSKAEELLDSMSLEEKIGQLFIIRPDALQTDLTLEQINDPVNNGVTELDAKMLENLKDYHLGGVVFFGKNILSSEQLTTFISEMQRHSAISLFVGIDEEGGRVSRLANSPHFEVPKFESMQKVPNITTEELPSSFSLEMIGEKLREELGYKGVIITDSLAMGAITKTYSSSDSAVKALSAGIDIILMPEDFKAAYQGIYNEVQKGIISEARIDESVLRILELKERYNLL